MPQEPSHLSRRDLLRTAVGTSVAGGLAVTATASAAEPDAQTKLPPEDFKATGKNVKQSVMAWCFNPMPMETLIPACANMGLVAMEGLDKKWYPLMKEHGLKVSLCSGHGFAEGPVNPEYQPMCRETLKEAIDTAVKWDCKNVITFTGMEVKGQTFEQGTKNCVDFFKSIVPYAEENGVTLVMEHLNTRDDSHPMKGHPGYFGDDVDHCIDIIKQVDSPNFKLLFDFYHVQIMNGDVTRRFHQLLPYIGHLHTAGNPGRCEIDENQEMNYAAIIRAVADSDYDGYVVQEYIPTWDDKIAALRHGVALCDV
ncbi:hydroxypyruvate isomerase family protein [Bremerella sp. T1]|uniref:hydroxypyruvate isomerase family protein n=1 Tax=Bremerella sp. TYQ1 TaxID=3119568 RepID=UPI001CC9788A|nr:TIM barrel protein [Bremerella volcania]UBM36309.1 TIM barrel protein [Bremerella volcania]